MDLNKLRIIKMYGFFKGFSFFKKSTVFPVDTVSHKTNVEKYELNIKQMYITTLNLQLEIIDNFFNDLQNTSILLDIKTKKQYMNDVEKTYNALNVERNFTNDYNYFTTIKPLPFY